MITKIAIVCAVLAVGAFIYLTGYIDLGNRADQNSVEKITEGAFAPNGENSMRGSGSFKNVLGLKKNVVCDVSYIQEGAPSPISGKVYTNGEKMRANFMMNMEGTATETNVINDGKEMYIWGKGASGDMAMKFTIDESTNSKTEQGQFDMNTDVDYSCQNWNVDASVFIPPSNLNFMDTSSMMKQGANGQPSAPDMKAMQCSMCDQVDGGDAKVECRATFACI